MTRKSSLVCSQASRALLDGIPLSITDIPRAHTGKSRTYAAMKDLKNHMKREHKTFFCDACVEYNKNAFVHEHVVFTEASLLQVSL